MRDLPASPPPAVLAEMEVALERAEELARAGFELALEHDGDGRLVIELRGAGRVRRLRPSELLELAAS